MRANIQSHRENLNTGLAATRSYDNAPYVMLKRHNPVYPHGLPLCSPMTYHYADVWTLS